MVCPPPLSLPCERLTNISASSSQFRVFCAAPSGQPNLLSNSPLTNILGTVRSYSAKIRIARWQVAAGHKVGSDSLRKVRWLITQTTVHTTMGRGTFITMAKRPYDKSPICDCGTAKDRRSLRCKACQVEFDKQLRRPLDDSIVYIDGHIARQIFLTQGQIAYVSPGKWKKVSRHNWIAWWNVKTSSYYAVRNWKKDGKHGTIHLHNVVFKARPGERADHKSRNTLDCTDKNLRSGTHGQNMCNSGKHKNNTSGYKGVTWNKRAQKWQAQICLNKKHYFLGLFEDPTEAHKAYCAAAIKLHGEFACFG
jgi:AP2 domain